MIGKTLSHYRILEKLGEGGMGVVYKARDTHLDRFVAIKILPAERVADPEHKRRFVQEAKAASALNHPNIIHIYDIDQQDGVDFIAMEYVAGKTLDQLTPRHGMRLNEALKTAVQMADALARAHAAGIVHRDLKPANIMVDEHGLVKVLDFGLAKLTETLPPGEDDATLTAKPSTEEGKIVGTVAYMSPEQAEGKKVDSRSDIFSFGSVLYEMFTGRRAFQGETKASTIAAILKEDPKPASQLTEALPKELERVITRCLRKDRERRTQHLDDVKLALLELKEESDSGKMTGVPISRPSPRRALLLAAGLVAVFVVTAVALWFGRSTPPLPEVPLIAVPLTSDPGEERDPSFSPDGNQVAFSWNGERQDNLDIYVKQIGSGAQLRLTTSLEKDSCPAWSRDGSSVAFIRQGPPGKDSVYLVSPLGPPEHKLAEISPREDGWPRGLAWTPDGKSLVVTDGDSVGPSGLFLLSVDSGERRRLTSPPHKMSTDSQPAFSSDGGTLAFVREVAVGVRDIYLLTLSEDLQPVGEPKRLTFENHLTFKPVWTLDGREIVFSSGPYLSPNLFRIAASGSGKPQRLAAVGEDGSEGAISRRTQRLVYTRDLIDVNIWRLELPGPYRKASLSTKLVSSTRIDSGAQFSPDGKKIAFHSNRTGSFELWICDSDGSNAQALTSRGEYCGTPRWSPDGERIAFDSTLGGQRDIFVTSANGGKPKRLTDGAGDKSAPSWSRDGKWIYFASDRSGEYQVWKMAADGGKAVQLTRKGGIQALESFDTRWVYYAKRGPLYMIPRDGGEETQVVDVSKPALVTTLWFDQDSAFEVVNEESISFRGPIPLAVISSNFSTSLPKVFGPSPRSRAWCSTMACPFLRMGDGSYTRRWITPAAI